MKSKCLKCNKKAIDKPYYNESMCQDHENLRVKAIYQKELKDIRNIYVVGLNKSTNQYWDRGHWNKFQLYYIKKNDMVRIWLYFANNAHWVYPKEDYKGGYFYNHVLGMDRVFDIVYSLGDWLFDDGYRFKEKWLSGV